MYPELLACLAAVISLDKQVSVGNIKKLIVEYKKVRIQESGVRLFEKLLNYQIGIFGVSLKTLTAVSVACR